MKARLTEYLESNNLITNLKVAFVTTIEPHLNQAFAKGNKVIGVFVDIEKAYDMTRRHGILLKLHKLGIRDEMFNFIESLIHNRSFRVNVNRHFSKSCL